MSKKKKTIIYILAILAPIALIFFSLFVGRYEITIGEVLAILGNGIVLDSTDIATSLIYEIRLPRALMAFMVGASLAIAGGALQGMFRNPLVDSGMLGVSTGAAFGACLGILLFGGASSLIYGLSFAFGLSAVLLSCLVAKIYNSAPTVTLVLGGVVVSAVFSALISFVKYVADPLDKLPTITFWLMGSLSRASFDD